VMVEIFYLFNCRSLTRPIWRLGWFSNIWIWVGAAAMLLLQLAFTYLPLSQRLFATASIGPLDWLLIVACGAAAAVVVGIEKRWRQRG
jgi:cation-transporting P-type ATPase F